MDGVLVNNTQAHVKAFEIFCERYGVEDWQHKLQTAFGMGNDDIMRLILPEEIIREKGMKALGEEKEAIYREVYAPEIRPVRGLVDLLEELRRRGIKDIMVILILGMMFSSGVGAVVQILQYLSNEAALKSFVVWTMGSLGDVTLGQLGLLLPAVVLGLVLAVAVIKPLNLLLLGENYARTMGLDIRRSRQLIFLSTTLLAGTVTAFCGPIGFIGLAVPHVARILFADADHRILVPASILTGIVVMLLCDVLAKLLTFPINTITALLGIPIVIWVVIRNKSIV